MTNPILKLYNVVSIHLAATRDSLAERLQSIHETASLLYNRVMEKIEYGRERLKNIVEKEAREEEKEKEQQQDDEEYDTVPEINLVHEGKCIKKLRVIENLNSPNTKMIMDNIRQHIEMRAKVIYSFKAEIHQGAGKIMDYSKRH